MRIWWQNRNFFFNDLSSYLRSFLLFYILTFFQDCFPNFFSSRHNFWLSTFSGTHIKLESQHLVALLRLQGFLVHPGWEILVVYGKIHRCTFILQTVFNKYLILSDHNVQKNWSKFVVEHSKFSWSTPALSKSIFSFATNVANENGHSPLFEDRPIFLNSKRHILSHFLSV